MRFRRKGFAASAAGGSGFRPDRPARAKSGTGRIAKRRWWSAGGRGVAQAASCVDEIRVRRAGVGSADDTVRRLALRLPRPRAGVKETPRKGAKVGGARPPHQSPGKAELCSELSPARATPTASSTRRETLSRCRRGRVHKPRSRSGSRASSRSRGSRPRTSIRSRAASSPA